MADGALTLQVITPDRASETVKADAVVIPTPDGYIAIWPNHAPMIAAVDTGVMWFREGKTQRTPDTTFAIGSGFLEVLDNQISIFTESAERGNEIDIERAEASMHRAQERLRLKNDDVDVSRAQRALARAIARMRAANRS